MAGETKEYIATLEKYVKHLEDVCKANDDLIKTQTEMIYGQREQVHAHRQWTAHEYALTKTSEFYAHEQRAILNYVLERSDRARDWLRLWEALPDEQKEVYRAEAAAWLKKQRPAEGDGREILLPAPKKQLCGETHIDDPGQDRWVFCYRCGKYLGVRDLKSGQLVAAEKDLKSTRKG